MIRNSEDNAILPVKRSYIYGETYQLIIAVSAGQYIELALSIEVDPILANLSCLDISAVIPVRAETRCDTACDRFLDNGGDEMPFDRHVTNMLDLVRAWSLLPTPEANQSLKAYAILASRSHILKQYTAGSSLYACLTASDEVARDVKFENVRIRDFQSRGYDANQIVALKQILNPSEYQLLVTNTPYANYKGRIRFQK